MIHIEKGQFVAENPSLKVVSKTGDYEDSDLIEFKDINSEDELVAGAYQAQFVKYGGLVYRFNEAKDLGEEILKIDPESTHSAAAYVRMSKELLNQMNKGELDPNALKEIQEAEQIVPEEVIPEVLGEEDEEVPEEEEEETQTTVPSLDIDVATTTPSIITTTSTPAVDIPDISVSSTTPTIDTEPEPIIEEPVKEENPTTDDTSSTTSEIVAFAKKKVKKTIRKKLGL